MASFYVPSSISNSSGGGKIAATTKIASNGSTKVSESVVVAAQNVIQTESMRFVSQAQIDEWNSLKLELQEENSVLFKWHQEITVSSSVIASSGLITLPNNKTFFDLDDSGILVFVNEKYISPSGYHIVNQRQICISTDIISSGDRVNIIHLNKENGASNYDTRLMALAVAWSYSYQNDTSSPLFRVEIDSAYSFINRDSYSLLIYVDGNYVHPASYRVISNTTLELDNPLPRMSRIDIVQLARVLPNEEYIGFMWGESITCTEKTKIFTLPDNRAFSNIYDNSILVYVDGKITRQYSVLDTRTIQFDDFIENGSVIVIIQFGFTADISRLKEILDSSNLEKILAFDINDYVPKSLANVAGGYASIDSSGHISSSVLNIEEVASLIASKLDEKKWVPESTKKYLHIHDNLDDINRLSVRDEILYLDENPVGEVTEETYYTVRITEDDVVNCFIELPSDCDTASPIVLTTSGITQLSGEDYTLIEQEWPLRDIISWRNLGLEEKIMVGDSITVTYYKKRYVGD